MSQQLQPTVVNAMIGRGHCKELPAAKWMEEETAKISGRKTAWKLMGAALL